MSNSEKAEEKKQEPSPQALKTGHGMMLACCMALFVFGIVMQYLYAKTGSENARLKNIIKMATFYIEGDLPRAAKYLDFLDHGSTHLPDEFQPLANQVRKAFALHLFEQARQEFDSKKFDHAENDFGVAKFYAGGSDLKEALPPWVVNLGERIKLHREAKNIEQELAKIHTAKGWAYYFEGKISNAEQEYKKALEYDSYYEPAKEGLRALGKIP